MNKIKIGIIGCGKQAPKHISGFRNLQGVEPVLADLDADIARKLASEQSLPYVDHLNAIFQDESISAVDICTPTPSHDQLISSALNSGKHFFCEKPLCDTLAAARKIQQAMKSSPLIGMIGYIYRFAPVFETAWELLKEAADSGISRQLGKIVTAYFRIGGRGSHRVWKHRRETGGGAVNEMLVHMLDLAIWFFGSPQKISLLASDLLRPERVINGKNETVDAEDYVLVKLEMAHDIQVVCQADMVTPAFTQFIEIQGDNGSFMGSIQADMPSYIYLNDPRDPYSGGKTVLNPGRQNLFESQMAEFVQAVRTGRQPMRCTVDDSVKLLETVEEIKRRIF
jgi:predicted dehydrogenase